MKVWKFELKDKVVEWEYASREQQKLYDDVLGKKVKQTQSSQMAWRRWYERILLNLNSS